MTAAEALTLPREIARVRGWGGTMSSEGGFAMRIIMRFWDWILPSRCLRCREKMPKTDGHLICASCDRQLQR
jgi:hypothetical protein